MKNKKPKRQILQLGCGLNKKQGAIGVDINKNSQADIIHDLNKFPYPFDNNLFGLIIAEHILEHLDDIPKVMQEIHRIGKNHAKIIILSSHFTSVDSFTDPTHKHFFTSRSFDYFIPGADLYKLRYSDFTFRNKSVILGPSNLPNPLFRLLLAIINKKIIFYEKHFAFLFPVGVVRFELEVIKNENK